MTIARLLRKPSTAPWIFPLLVVLALCVPVQPAYAEIHVDKNLLFTTAGGMELRGDMYLPRGQGPFPGILFIHGGGFVGGTKDWESLVPLITFFVEHGYAVFNIDYRLLNQGGMFPNNILDAKCGLAWMKAQATDFHIDTTRMGVMGESAGAYLAAMLAFTQNQPRFQPVCPGFENADTSVQAAVLFYPPTDFATFNGGFSQVLEIAIKQMTGLRSKKEIVQFKKDYSPVNYVNTAPPVFLSYTDPDHTVPTQQGRALARALGDSGAVFEVYEATGDGMDHGFILTGPDTPQAVEARTRALAFLNVHLAQPGTQPPGKE